MSFERFEDGGAVEADDFVVVADEGDGDRSNAWDIRGVDFFILDIDAI